MRKSPRRLNGPSRSLIITAEVNNPLGAIARKEPCRLFVPRFQPLQQPCFTNNNLVFVVYAFTSVLREPYSGTKPLHQILLAAEMVSVLARHEFARNRRHPFTWLAVDGQPPMSSATVERTSVLVEHLEQ